MTKTERRGDLVRCILVLLLVFVVLGLAGESDRHSAGERRYQVARVLGAMAFEGGE